ncbi:MAG TPA: DUF3574 domain-containing protein [Thermoanaerobaculia bacterium]|nr:DUF3574 domain-containing protein [Thermoanaerobaculia bacterium]
MRAAAAMFVLLLTACATMPPAVEEAIVADRLFCGRAIPGGGSVSDEEWDTFVREVVAARFPDGFTVFTAEGQWRGRDGAIVREPVMVIEILHPFDRELDRKIAEIADEYRRRFRQDAVMRVTMPARMEFR